MQLHECYLLMKNDYTWLGYKVHLSEDQYINLKAECEQYNDWYYTVLNGTAPLSAYSNVDCREDVMELISPIRRFDSEVDYEYSLCSPHYDKWKVWDEDYTHNNGTVEKIRMVSYPVQYDNGEWEDYVDEYTHVISSSIVWLDNANIIVQSIIDKYDPYNEFSIGCILLPTTSKLIKDRVIKIGDGMYEYMQNTNNI